MINVLLCGEGTTDHGHEVYQNDKYIRQDGALQVFIRKCADGIDFVFEVISSSQVKKLTAIFRKRQFESKETIKARALAQTAKDKDCTHIAYHRDEDNKGLVAMLAQVQSYFSVAESSGRRCIAVVPQHMTESWLLADPDAFPRTPDNPTLPRNPEEAWGIPESETHPKQYIKRVLAQFNKDSSTETFAEIARKTNIEILRTRCPKSFEPFYADMKKFVNGE